MTPRVASRLVAIVRTVWAVATLAASGAAAQDFSDPSPPGASASPLAYIENGLPPVSQRFAAQAAVTRWFAIPDLETRSAALGLGVGAARLALGVSRSGDAEIGWSALALACGAALDGAGAALRGAIRRDVDPSSIESPLGAGVGAEVGGGAWLAPDERVRLWADAPQLWTRGAAPPLARGLEIGGAWESRDLRVWLARRSPSRLVASVASRSVGFAFRSGGWMLWVGARDHPLRGGFGLAGRLRALRVACSVESHPVLGETTSFSCGVARGSGP